MVKRETQSNDSIAQHSAHIEYIHLSFCSTGMNPRQGHDAKANEVNLKTVLLTHVCII